MAVTILVTPVLRQFTDNQQSVEVEGTTVRECLNHFIARYPDTEKWVFANLPMVCIFLNKKVVLFNNLDEKVAEGDVIDLSPVVAGG